jgi:hypothetical protein
MAFDDAHVAMQTNDHMGNGFVLTPHVAPFKSFTVEMKWIEPTPYRAKS